MRGPTPSHLLILPCGPGVLRTSQSGRHNVLGVPNTRVLCPGVRLWPIASSVCSPVYEYCECHRETGYSVLLKRSLEPCRDRKYAAKKTCFRLHVLCELPTSGR